MILETPAVAALNTAADFAAAVLTAGALAPIVAAVDRAVVLRNAGKSTNMMDPMKEHLLSCIKHPFRFFALRSTLIAWGLYIVPYSVSNVLETQCDLRGIDSAMPKFFGTAALYVPLSILQDRAYAQIFGKGAARGLPGITWALFIFRDASNLFMSFSLPQKIADWTASPGDSATHAKRRQEAQFALPIGSQVYSTALHVLGLDFYNRQNMSFGARLPQVAAQFPQALALRLIRLGGVFSIGGVGNTHLRTTFRELIVNSHRQLNISGEALNSAQPVVHGTTSGTCSTKAHH
jgi:hypothetical protein